MGVGGERLDGRGEHLIGGAGDIRRCEQRRRGGQQHLVGLASRVEPGADLLGRGGRGVLCRTGIEIPAHPIEDVESGDQCMQRRGSLMIGPPEVLGCCRMERVEGGNHLCELEAQSGETRGLRCSDRVSPQLGGGPIGGVKAAGGVSDRWDRRAVIAVTPPSTAAPSHIHDGPYTAASEVATSAMMSMTPTVPATPATAVPPIVRVESWALRRS